MTEITVSPATLDMLVTCAVRYALGRTSYIVGDVCDTAAAYADQLSPDTRARLAREVSGYVSTRVTPLDLRARWQTLADRLAEGAAA